MLEKPDLQDEKIIACLYDEYGLPITQLTFLPLGADINAAVYRAVTADETAYFVKLRRGAFDEIFGTLPKFLSDQGIQQIIKPMETNTGQLWANLDPFKVILYPFVEGNNAYEVNLLDRHWSELGAALKCIHTISVPSTLTQHIPQERYSPQWRDSVKLFLGRVDEPYADPVSSKLAALLKDKFTEIRDLVERTERLALMLQTRPLELIVCHSDLHAGNLLIDTHGVLYIVDWDNPILAPKERDLMFIGGGLGGAGHTPQEEEALFYQGYGPTLVDPVALAYYRYERIIQDIAAYCEQIFWTDGDGPDREQALLYVASNFLPGAVLEIAYQSDKSGIMV